MKRKSPYEGLQEDIRRLKTPAVEVWKNQYSDKKFVVKLEIPEFTCLCPKTGLPDFATIHVRYLPGKWCLELKSLKNYFFFYRSVGIFHEHLANKILEDLVRCAQPRWLEVVGEFNVRGGIRTTVSAEYKRGKKR